LEGVLGWIGREAMVTPVSRGAAGAGSEPRVLCGVRADYLKATALRRVIVKGEKTPADDGA
jgi:hypothetical protein